jgi:hypothetical protein
MLNVYERLQREGKIGPRDENGVPRPFQEFPKRIDLADGSSKIVLSQREELAFAGQIAGKGAAQDDPVVEERNRLAMQVAEMQAANERLREQLASMKEAAVAAPPANDLPPGVTIGNASLITAGGTSKFRSPPAPATVAAQQAALAIGGEKNG